MESIEQQAKEYVEEHVPERMQGVAFQVYCEAYQRGVLHYRAKGLFWFCLGVAFTIIATLVCKIF